MGSDKKKLRQPGSNFIATDWNTMLAASTSPNSASHADVMTKETVRESLHQQFPFETFLPETDTKKRRYIIATKERGNFSG